MPITHFTGQRNGTHFVRKDVTELGYVITLGHHGSHCPQVDYSKAESFTSFTLVDTNGIHSTKFVFCDCV
ncbi:hypothetical protein DFH09DRAFT_1141436, partial [Mycena vulgaris]